MKKYKSSRKQGVSLLEIVVLIILLTVFIMFLISQFGTFGPGTGGVSGSKGSGSNPPQRDKQVNNPPKITQPHVPPQPSTPQNPSKLILEWSNPDDIRDIETKINNQLKPEARTVVIRTQKIKITTAIKEKVIELIKNKGSEAELKIEQLK